MNIATCHSCSRGFAASGFGAQSTTHPTVFRDCSRWLGSAYVGVALEWSRPPRRFGDAVGMGE